MKGNGFDIEAIEEYVMNKLSPEKKALLEEAILKDPLLKAEVDVQKDTIQSIQAFRKAELKDRLNKIEIPANNWFNQTKLAASVLILASVTGILFYLSQQPEKQEIVLSNEVAVTEDKLKEPELIKEAPKTRVEAIEPKPELETSTSADITSEKMENLQPEVKPATKPEKAEATNSQPEEVIVPDFSSTFEDTDELDKNVVLPEDKVAQVTDTKTKIDVKLIEKTGKINYQYYNNKLFLYGEFSAKPYELLELNTHKGKQLYLFFEDQYYHLKPNTMEETTIDVMNNPELRRQLEKIRVK